MAQSKSISRVARGESLADIREAVRTFAAERDWDQFHSPRNLATALIVEAAELLEHFQWDGVGEAHPLSEETAKGIEEEVADVFLFLVRLADKLDIDLISAATRKLEINRQKYPIDKARGRSTKYTKL